MNVVVPFFLLAPLVLIPLGYRLLSVVSPGSGPPRWVLAAMAPAAILLAVSFSLAQGPLAAALVLPWVAVTGSTAVLAGWRLLGDPDRFRPSPRHATDAAVAFLAIGATFALTDRLGARPFGFGADVILLTAVHFHFAGFVVPLAGALAYRRRPSRWLEIAIGFVVVGIPTTAIGFFGFPVINWIGSMLVATGGFGIALGTLLVARTMATPTARALTGLAGVSLLIAMPLAAIYATGTFTGSAWLDLSTMAHIHGGLNSLGFALPVVVAWTLERRSRRSGDGPADPLDVMAFNAWPFVAGPVIAIAGVVALFVVPMPDFVRVLVAIGAVGTGFVSAAAIIAVVWVFDWTSEDRWAWVTRTAGSPSSWLDITTGFDDSSAQLRCLFPASQGLAVDLFDPTIEHEEALRRARRRFAPAGPPIRAEDLGKAFGEERVDAVFLLMAAHEIHGSERRAMFAAIAKILGSTGRLIVVEHLRDLANTIAFGPGSRHFESRSTWLQSAVDAGLLLVDEQRLSPFVRGFVFEPAPR